MAQLFGGSSFVLVGTFSVIHTNSNTNVPTVRIKLASLKWSLKTPGYVVISWEMDGFYQ